MRLGKDQNGFSLMEMVIAIAIIGILAGFSINMIAYIRSANIEKAVQEFADDMSKVQLRNKTHEKLSYLYITVNHGDFYGCIMEERKYKNVTSDMIAKNGHCYGKAIDIRFFKVNNKKRSLANTIITEGVVCALQFDRQGNMRGMYCIVGGTTYSYEPYRITFEGRNSSGKKISAMGKQIKFSNASGRHFIEPLEVEPEDDEKP